MLEHYKKHIINPIFQLHNPGRVYMKKISVVLLGLLVAVSIIWADKPELKPYGFIKGDMIYASQGVYSWGNPANNYISSSQIADTLEDGALGFTAQHTRFGLKGSIGEDIKVGGKLELDFYVGRHDANGNPRMRLAYASVTPIKGLEIRMGQQWDLISPVNASTNNTNGNMWYAGNIGFRRPQLQLRYSHDMGSIVPQVQVSAGEASKEKSGTTLGSDNLAKMPMIQARLGAKAMKKMDLGVSYVMASYGKDKDYSTSGIGVDFNLPLHKLFALKGEFNMGTNLNNANLFTIAGSRLATDTTDHKSTGVWVNAISKPMDHLNLVVGFGMDMNSSDDLADGTMEKNQVIYVDLIIPVVAGFSFALEYEKLDATIKGGDTQSANVIDLAAKVTF
jgi:hypothetical protein